MRQFLMYDTATGFVTGSATTRWIEMVEINHEEHGMELIEIPLEADPFAYYVDLATDAAKLREPMPAVLTGLNLSGLPVPSVITIDGIEYPCNTDTVSLEFDQPGVYTVKVTAVGYLDQEFEVTYAN